MSVTLPTCSIAIDGEVCDLEFVEIAPRTYSCPSHSDRWVATLAAKGIDGFHFRDSDRREVTPLIGTGAHSAPAHIPDSDHGPRLPVVPMTEDRLVGLEEITSGMVAVMDTSTTPWQGVDHHSPVCTVRNSHGDECGTRYRPIWRDGNVTYACPTHGDKSSDWAPEIQAERRIPLERTAHVAFCHAMVPSKRRHGQPSQCQESGKVAGWTCPTHGAESSAGADIPALTDDGVAATFRPTISGVECDPTIGGTTQKWSIPGRSVEATISWTESHSWDGSDAIQHQMPRGEMITQGNRQSYTGRNKGKRGQAVTGESLPKVMGGGRIEHKAVSSSLGLTVVSDSRGRVTAVLGSARLTDMGRTIGVAPTPRVEKVTDDVLVALDRIRPGAGATMLAQVEAHRPVKLAQTKAAGKASGATRSAKAKTPERIAELAERRAVAKAKKVADQRMKRAAQRRCDA
jgi:hypothetical protein